MNPRSTPAWRRLQDGEDSRFPSLRRAGDPGDPTSDGDIGEELPRGFAQYYGARFETEPQRRAERLLLANLWVGLHEQIRLQEAIAGSVRAPLRRGMRSTPAGCRWGGCERRAGALQSRGSPDGYGANALAWKRARVLSSITPAATNSRNEPVTQRT